MDKLKEFETIALQEAHDYKQKQLKKINQEMAKQAEEIVTKEKTASQQYVDDIFSSLMGDKNKKILRQKHIYKKQLAEIRANIIEDIILDIKEKLQEFVKTPVYLSYLQDSISKNLKYIEKIELTEQDMVYKEEISHLITITKSEEDFIGGFKVIAENKILDFSFKTMLEQEVEKIGR